LLHARDDAGGQAVTGFTLLLQSAGQHERIEGVTSFVGEDDTGSFGILPGHARMIAVLTYGLARFRAGPEPWVYVALPGGVLYFVRNELRISTRRYFKDSDYRRISGGLLDRLLGEEEEIRATRESVYRLEQEMFRRLREMARRAA
jgi:F-type H+-transporting ATPase subunit epsilon